MNEGTIPGDMDEYYHNATAAAAAESVADDTDRSEYELHEGQSVQDEAQTQPDLDVDLDDDEEEEEENVAPYQWDQLPEHACRYCGIHNPLSVIKCVNTGKWFCNCRGSTSGAHIIQHLARTKNKEVSLHPDR